MKLNEKILDFLYDNIECFEITEGRMCPFIDECEENDNHCIIKRELELMSQKFGCAHSELKEV